MLAEHGLWAQKKFGQNFLFDFNITRKIARAAGELGVGTIIEVGPGPGGLTRALFMEGARHVIALEKDPRFQGLLSIVQQAAAGEGDVLDVLFQDALWVDYPSLCPPPRRIVANLPYNVGTPLLFRWLETPHLFTRLVLMFQKEVADRLLAEPNTSDYGRLSIMCQSRMAVRRLMDVPPEAFTPSPKVTSTVVVLTPLSDGCSDDLWRALEGVTRHAFGARRKMLRQSLKPLFGGDVVSFLRGLDIDPTDRAERLDIPTFLKLAQFYRDCDAQRIQ